MTLEFQMPYTVHTVYSVIGFGVKSGIMSILEWYRFPYTNNYWVYRVDGVDGLPEMERS